MTDRLPENWSSASLGDLGQMVGGGTPSKDNLSFWINGTIPWVSPKDFRTDMIIDTQDHITEEAVFSSSTSLVPAGAVLIVTRSGILSNSLPIAITTTPVTINQDIKALIPAEGISAQYVAAALRRYSTQILRECTKPGTTVPSIVTSRLQAFSIPVAPSLEQERIVVAIEAIAARVTNAQHAITSLPSMLARYQSVVLHLALQGRATPLLRSQLDEDASGSTLAALKATREAGGKSVVSPSTNLTETFTHPKAVSWPFVTLESVCDPSRGITYGVIQTGDDTEGGVPTVRAGDIKNFKIDIGGLKRIRRQTSDRYPRTILRGGEVLISIRGTTGNVAVVPPQMAGMNVSREVAVIPVLSGIEPCYVAYALSSPTGQAIITRQIKGIAQSGINLIDLRQFPLPLPSQIEQLEIVKFVDDTLCRINTLRARAEDIEHSLKELLAATLRKAFKGEIASRNPSDEPAMLLLQRSRSTKAVHKSRVRPATVGKGRQVSVGKKTMPQSRKTVKPNHLQAIVVQSGERSLPVKELYLRADMDVEEFYKQLAIEVALGQLQQSTDKTRLEIVSAT